jgi:hypothetical protein
VRLLPTQSIRRGETILLTCDGGYGWWGASDDCAAWSTIDDGVGHLWCFSSGDDSTNGDGGPWRGSRGGHLGLDCGEAVWWR